MWDENDELANRCESAVETLKEMGYDAKVESVNMIQAKLSLRTWDDPAAEAIADAGLKVNITYGQGHMLGSEYRTAVAVMLA